jgi:hypothetical protein
VSNLLALGEKAEHEVVALEEMKVPNWDVMKEIVEWGTPPLRVRDLEAPAALCSTVRGRPRPLAPNPIGPPLSPIRQWELSQLLIAFSSLLSLLGNAK